MLVTVQDVVPNWDGSRMPQESKSEQKIREIIHKISRHSPIFYVAVIILLTVFQLDIFKNNVPKDYIINGVLIVSMFALVSNALDKVIRKKQDAKPFLYCPECPNAKMHTTGKWVCEECHKEFAHPKTDNEASSP